MGIGPIVVYVPHMSSSLLRNSFRLSKKIISVIFQEEARAFELIIFCDICPQ